MGVCNCSMFCCTLLYVHFSIAIILMGKRELIALLNLSSWCLVMVEGLFLTVPLGCLQFVIVVFPDHTHLLFLLSFIFALYLLNTWVGFDRTFIDVSLINCIVVCWSDKHWLSHSMCLYQVMMTLHFLNDVANDAESTQKSIIT